jgi:hypothetical protein
MYGALNMIERKVTTYSLLKFERWRIRVTAAVIWGEEEGAARMVPLGSEIDMRCDCCDIRCVERPRVLVRRSSRTAEL